MPTRRRLHVEEIEARVTPAPAFVPDPSFGTAGVTTLPAAVTPYFVSAELPGGGVAVGGTIGAREAGRPTGTDAAILRLTAAGAIDTGFGAGGVVTLDSGLTGANGAGAAEGAGGVVPLADGRLVVLAGVQYQTVAGDAASAIVVFRLLPDGSPDTAFGDGGRLVLPPDVTNLQGVLPDGGLVGVFSTNVPGPGIPTASAPVTNDLFVEVVRYTPAGRPDPALDGDGRTKLAIASVLRYGDGSDRYEPVSFLPVGPVAVAADGAVTFVLGDYNYDLNFSTLRPGGTLLFREMVRLTAAGVPDAAFGDGGKRPLTVTQGTPDFTFVPRAVFPDGSALVALYRDDHAGRLPRVSGNSALVRFTADGAADPTFGDAGGIVGLSFGVYPDRTLTVRYPVPAYSGYREEEYSVFTADGVLVARYDAANPAYDPAVVGLATASQVVTADGRRYLISFNGPDPSLVVRLISAASLPVVPPVVPPVPPPVQVPPQVTAAGGRVTLSRADAADVLVTPFPEFAGDLRAAAGVRMVAAGTGPGGPARVAVLDPITGDTVRTLAPFEDAFTAGVFVTLADLTGDGVADVLVTPGAGGGPRVRAYDGATGSPLADFFAIEDAGFRGGVAVAVADVNGDGTPDLAVAAAAGGGPRVAVYDGKSLSETPTRLTADFFAFDPAFRGGVTLAAADFNADGSADLAIGAGDGGGPAVVVFRGDALAAGQVEQLAAFVQGDASSRAGAAVAARDIDGDGSADLVVAAGGRVRGYHRADVAFGDAPAAAFDMTPAEAAAAGIAVT